MNLTETIQIAIVSVASLSMPVILGYVLYAIRDLHRDLHRDISAIHSCLGRIEGHLFGQAVGAPKPGSGG